jgi:hypothetical protein
MYSAIIEQLFGIKYKLIHLLRGISIIFSMQHNSLGHMMPYHQQRQTAVTQVLAMYSSSSSRFNRTWTKLQSGMIIHCTTKGRPSLHILPAMVIIYVKNRSGQLKMPVPNSIKVSKH